MKKYTLYIALFLLVAGATGFMFCSKPATGKDEINWVTLEEAMKLNEKKPKKVMIDVYTSWCHWCKVMDKTTFQDEAVVKYINKNFYAVKFNAEGKGSVTFNGQEYTPNQLAKSGFNVRGYPSTVFLDGGNNYATLAPGYWKPEDYKTLLEFVSGDHYKTTEWEVFKEK